jgi:ABC-type glycerol-3-phosphate transport system substrate-binding protein
MAMTRKRDFRTSALLVFLVSLVMMSLVASPGGFAAQQDKTITFWSAQTAILAVQDSIKAAAAKFEAGHPGVKVNVEFISWGEIDRKYLTAVSGKLPPQAGEHGPSVAVQFAAAQYLDPVDDIINAIGKDKFNRTWLNTTYYNGHYWGVPWFYDSRPIAYRKDLFKEKGLAIPKTWDDLTAAAKALTLSGDRWGMGIRPDDRGQDWFALCLTNGGGIFKAEGNTVKVAVNSKENQEALTFYTDLFLKHKVTPPGTPTYQTKDIYQLFTTGKIAMATTPAELLRVIDEQAPALKGKVGYFLQPAAKPGKPYPGMSFMGGSHFMLFKDAPNKDITKEFIKFMLQADTYKDFMRALMTKQPALNILKAQDYLSDPAWREAVDVAIEQGEHAARSEYPMLAHPISGELDAIFGKPAQEVLSGKKTVVQALDDMQRRVEELWMTYEAAKK